MSHTPNYEEYSDLPRYVLARHFPDRRGDEDLLQEGRLELWLSILDADKARNFFNYAYKRIYRAYVRALRDRNPFTIVPMDGREPEDQRAREAEEAKELCEAISRVLKGYPEECRVLCLRARGYTYRQIADRMDKSYTTVRRLAKQGGAKLRLHGAI